MAAPRLHEVQELFFRAIAGRPGNPAKHALAVIVDEGAVGRFERIAVYEQAYFLRLTTVLRDYFPRTASLLGVEAFEALVRDYLHAFPSTHPSVRYLGGALAQFVAGRAGVPPWLADLVRLEWERTEMFDAADSEAASMASLFKISADQWPQMRLYPIAALQMLQLQWPVHELWAGAEPAAIVSRPTTLRVWRAPDYSVRHAPMDRREAAALAGLMRNEPFGTICGVFSDLNDSQSAHEASSLLARWVADGLVTLSG